MTKYCQRSAATLCHMMKSPSPPRRLRPAYLLLFLAVLFSPAHATTGLDLHKLWHNHCYDCHGHAGDFARAFLSVSDGELQGRHHVDGLRMFLSHHYLVESEVGPVYEMLLAQANTPPRFQDECSLCHHTAAEFVRNSLDLRDGTLYSRKDGTPTRHFLEGHRKLNSEDVEFFIEQLTRVAREIYRP